MMENQAQYIEEDEIDLRELFATIKKHIKKILFFVFVMTALTLLYVLSLPNIYQSQTILSPQGQQKSMSGGLSSLAAMAGVNLGGGSDGTDPFTLMQTVLDDPSFNTHVINKYNLIEKLYTPKNLVFALGLDLYGKKDKVIEKPNSQEEALYKARLMLKKIISLSSDKKSGLITLKATHEDRFFAKELVTIYLNELANSVKRSDMKETEKQITYYQKELSHTYDVALKEQLSKSLSGLMQKRVFSNTNDFYLVSKLTEPQVSYIKEKVKPKRALILIVSFITSFILAIFMVFFWEFIKKEENEKIS